jgi:hypothetical protein
MLSPAIAAMKAGLAALAAGGSEAAGAVTIDEYRSTLGWGDYEDETRRLAGRG